MKCRGSYDPSLGTKDNSSYKFVWFYGEQIIQEVSFHIYAEYINVYIYNLLNLLNLLMFF